jgi:hypothetical protein
MSRQREPHRRTKHHKSWWIRVFAAFALCLVGAQGMLPSLHQAQVSHRVCAEHGELIEGTASHAGESEHAEPASQGVAIRGVAEGEHDSHCDCVLGAFLSGSEARRGDTLEELGAQTALAIDISAADSVVATEILSFAPKQSPPV